MSTENITEATNNDELDFAKQMNEAMKELQFVETQTRLINSKIAYHKAFTEAKELGLILEA